MLKIDPRLQFTVCMFAYLFLNSVMFGSIFSRPMSRSFVLIGLGCGMVSQVILLYILWLVKAKK